jgi:hypothetical protein
MDIKKILNSLGIETKNYGAAIGGDWLKTSGDTIISFSSSRWPRNRQCCLCN